MRRNGKRDTTSMRRRVRSRLNKRILTLFLAAAMLFSSADLTAFATEPGVGVETAETPEQSEENQEEGAETPDTPEEETETPETAEKGEETPRDSDEATGEDEENAGEPEETPGENAGEPEETPGEEMLAEILGEAVNTVYSTDELMAMEPQDRLAAMSSEGDIASGIDGDIVWAIDANGKLTAVGTANGSWRGPWTYRESIYSAEITITGITSTFCMFEYWINLSSLDLSGLDTSQVTDMRHMFSACSSLTSLDLSGFDTSQVTNMYGMFHGCSNLSSLDLSGLDTSQVTDMSHMFCNCSSLTSLDLSGFDTSRVASMKCMFYDCSSLSSLDVSKFDTSQVTKMDSMFNRCSSLSSLDVSSFDTSCVTDMSLMFCGCRSLSSLDVSGFDTSRVTDMAGMFFDCYSLSSLDVSGFDTSRVTDMHEMFCCCLSLISLDLTGLNTEKVINMEGMFDDCINLSSLDLSSFNTSQVTNMDEMFYNCRSLSSLDLSNLNTEKVVNMTAFLSLTNLTTIYTPYNLKLAVNLPANSTDKWYRSDGTVVTTLPTDLSYSVTLGKNYIPNDLPVDIVKEGITVNRKGYAQASFTLKNNKGEIQKEKELLYRFDDGSYMSIRSDKNGVVTLRSKLLENSTGTEEPFQMQTKDMVLCYNPVKSEKLNYGVTLKGSVTPLNFTQTWEMGVTGTLSGSIGHDVGAHVGVVEAEAELTKAEISGTLGGTLSVEHSYENGFRNLTLLQNYNAKIAANAKIGPAADAGALGQDIEVEVAEAGAGIAAGGSNGIGLRLENYDPANKEQRSKIGTFMLASAAQMKGNLLLLGLAELIGKDQYYNLEQRGVNISVETGADMGKVSFGNYVEGSAVSAEAEGIISYAQTKKLTDSSKEHVFDYGLGANASVTGSFLPIPQKNFLSASTNSTFELGAEIDGNNQIQGFSVTKEGRFAIEGIVENDIANAVRVSYGRDTVEQLAANVGVVKDFIHGSTRYVLGDAQQGLFEKLDTTPLKGTYSATVIDQEFCKNFELGLGASAVAGLELSVGIEGVSSCEYEVEGGSYESGRREVTNINEIKEEVAENSYTLPGLVEEPLVEIAKEIKGFLTDKFGKADEGIQNGWAKLEQLALEGEEKVRDWRLHIVALLKGDAQSAEPVSYAITAYQMEQPFAVTATGSEENEYKVYTIGDTYCVYVTDDAGNEIPDYSANPLTLTLSYSNEMLAAAGLDETQVNNIAVYMYSEEVYGYVCIGGTADVENRAVSVEITKPGQYILAADDAAPVIKKVTVSKDTNKPVITVEFQETSGFKEFSMKLDDEEVVGTSDWRTYYNKAYNAISYQVEKELSVGRHICSVYAVDTAGNAMAAPYEMDFLVGEGDDPKEDDPKVDDPKEDDPKEDDPKEDDPKEDDPKEDDPKVDDPELDDVLPGDIPSDGVIPDGLWIAGVNENGYGYTGKAIKPEVRVYDHKRLLVEKVDYTVTYQNNTKADEVLAEKTAPTITVTGKGNYSGKDTKTFKILPLDISQSTEDNLFEADDMAVVFNKKAQKPVPALWWNGKKLKNKTDYTFTYHKGTYNGTETEELVSVTDAGEYYITLTGKGNFAGTRRIKLTVLPAVTDEASVKLISKTTVVKIPNQSYLTLRDNGQATPEVTVKGGKTTLTKDVHYMVSYSNNSKVGTAYAIITGREEGGYSGTKRVSFKITGVSISKATVQGLSGQTFTYDGADIKPQLKLTVSLNGVSMELKEGTDYSVQWTKVSDAGTATVAFTGINGYTGTLKKTYKIKAYDIARNQSGLFKAELKTESVPYAKGGAKPELNVTFRKVDGSAMSLIEGKDYTVTYRNNTAYNDGSNANNRSYVTVKGKGNFAGTYAEKLYYQITAQDIGKMTLYAEDKVYQNKKNYYTTKVTVTDLDGKTLKAGTDYNKNLAYTYRDDTNLDNGVLRKAGESVDKNDVIPAGTVIRVTATPKGRNYTGTSVSGEYSVKPGSISGASVSIPKQTYTGRAITLKKEDITVKVKGKKLEPGQYEILSGSYQNNVKKGTATVTIRGIDNYGGTKKAKFTIRAKGFLWWWKK